jgi:thioesterase domain-containing protein
LLRLRGGNGTPLFCVHPAAGLGWVYSGLLRFLPSEHPVYALQAPGLGTPGYTPRSVDEVVTDYLERIRATQPEGPYALLGWSLGGLIAHLLAVRMQDEGEEVALLALLDSYPRVGSERHRAVAASQTNAVRELGVSLGHEVSPDGVLMGLADLAIPPLVRVFGGLRRLFADVTLGVFHGDLVMFTATADKPHGSPYTAELWREHVTGDIEVVPVHCAHGELTRPGPLSLIAPAVADRLSGVLGSTIDQPKAQV